MSSCHATRLVVGAVLVLSATTGCGFSRALFVKDGTDYCPDRPALPETDTFWSHDGPSRVVAYVVLDQAVTVATPQGRAGVFGTLQFEISDLRIHASSGPDSPLVDPTATAGTPCDDDATAFRGTLG